MLTTPIFGPKFPFAPSIMSIIGSIVVHCWSSQKWSTLESRPPTFGPHLHAPSKPIFISICGMTCILPNQPSMPPPCNFCQKLVMVLEPLMSSPYQLAKMVDNPRGFHVMLSCGFFVLWHVAQWEPLTPCLHCRGLHGWRVEFQRVDDLSLERSKNKFGPLEVAMPTRLVGQPHGLAQIKYYLFDSLPSKLRWYIGWLSYQILCPKWVWDTPIGVTILAYVHEQTPSTPHIFLQTSLHKIPNILWFTSFHNPYFIYPFDKLWPPWPFTWERVSLDVGVVGTKPI